VSAFTSVAITTKVPRLHQCRLRRSEFCWSACSLCSYTVNNSVEEEEANSTVHLGDGAELVDDPRLGNVGVFINSVHHFIGCAECNTVLTKAWQTHLLRHHRRKTSDADQLYVDELFSSVPVGQPPPPPPAPIQGLRVYRGQACKDCGFMTATAANAARHGHRAALSPVALQRRTLSTKFFQVHDRRRRSTGGSDCCCASPTLQVNLPVPAEPPQLERAAFDALFTAPAANRGPAAAAPAAAAHAPADADADEDADAALPGGEDDEDVEADEYSVADTNLFLAFAGWTETVTTTRSLAKLQAATALQPSQIDQREAALVKSVRDFFEAASRTIHSNAFSQYVVVP
jgi:hypothetical protein